MVPGARRLVLASRSPQRRAILEQLGFEFSVVVSGAEEIGEGDPAEVAVENARRKFEAAGGGPDVLAVDTLVALEGRIYGKPPDAASAASSLQALSGRVHHVVSGVVLGGATAVETTAVEFRPLPGEWVDWYVGTGEWRERAGGYAIQGLGAALVLRISGDYWNVVGLPVPALLALLADGAPRDGHAR